MLVISLVFLAQTPGFIYYLEAIGTSRNTKAVTNMQNRSAFVFALYIIYKETTHEGASGARRSRDFVKFSRPGTLALFSDQWAGGPGGNRALRSLAELRRARLERFPLYFLCISFDFPISANFSMLTNSGNLRKSARPQLDLQKKPTNFFFARGPPDDVVTRDP